MLIVPKNLSRILTELYIIIIIHNRKKTNSVGVVTIGRTKVNDIFV